MNGKGAVIAVLLLMVLWANTGLISKFIAANLGGVERFKDGDRSLPSFVIKDPKKPNVKLPGGGDDKQSGGSSSSKSDKEEKRSSRSTTKKRDAQPGSNSGQRQHTAPQAGGRGVGVQSARGL